MNWEAKLEEARQRRAVALAARQAAAKAGKPHQKPVNGGKARVVDMSKEPPQRHEPEPGPLPTLVLDDAYQVRSATDAGHVGDPEADLPPDLRDKKPMFRSSRVDMPVVGKSITGLAVVGIILHVAFLNAPANQANQVDTRTAAVLDVDPEIWPEIQSGAIARQHSAEDTKSAAPAPAQPPVTLADAIRPGLHAPAAMADPIVPFGFGPALTIGATDEPVLLASLDAPSGFFLSPPGAAPAEHVTVSVRPDTKRIRVIVPGDVSPDVREAIVARVEDVPKAELDGVAGVDYRVSATHVRYYHEADKEIAVSFADGIGAVARDFTDYETPETVGYLEVYLKGDGAAAREEAASVATPVEQDVAEAPRDDIARVIEDILQN